MKHYIYIISSLSTGIYYKGHSLDAITWLEYHNTNQSIFTRGECPWELVFTEIFENKSLTLKREKALKTHKRKKIEFVIKGEKNKLREFIQKLKGLRDRVFRLHEGIRKTLV